MILGIGVDLTSISRIKAVHDRFGGRFARRILASHELDEYAQKRDQNVFLAKRFAVKEAAVKALGTGERGGVLLKDFSISHDTLGKPMLTASGAAKRVMDHKGITQTHVSHSDERDSVIAFVILE